MSVTIDLSGKTALVTGAARGIGAAVAKKLAEAGADLVLLDRSKERLLRTERKVSACGVRTLAETCDTSDESSVKNTVACVIREFGHIDILVNNAAVNYREKAFEVDLEHWKDIMDVNLKGYFMMAREAARHMVQRGSGNIVNISSELSFVGVAEGQVAYSVSKAAVNQLTRVLAAEWAESNVRVNTVVPGLTETELIVELLAKPGYRERAESHIPLRRLGMPEDIASAVLFVASDAAQFITGQVLLVDGGYTNIR